MMRYFDNLLLSVKLGLLAALMVLCLVGTGVAGAALLKHEMYQDRISELHSVTETALSMASVLQKQVESGEMTRTAAIAAFGQRTRAMRYGGGQGYVFAYLTDCTAVSVPNAAQVGENFIDRVTNGRKIIREIRDAVAANGTALIAYDYPRPDSAELAPKISYAAAFPAWNMFIGTGAYVDDIDLRFRPILLGMVAGILFLTALMGGAAAIMARRIARPLADLQKAMSSLTSGHDDVDVPGAERRDEVGAMARAVMVFKTSAVEKQRLEADAVASGRQTEANRARAAAVESDAAMRQTHVVAVVASGLSRLAGGDVAHRIDEVFPADYEALRSDFNAALAKLEETMRMVAASATAIRSGTGEISTAAEDLSRRTEQQAASLEETATALDEITATVRKTADGARHARSVVGNARGSAEQSGQVVRQAVEAMSGIERSAREITQIIGVIDEIAFQTNLLALNAGVEAARAGEAGRGFAVVASEVRALAQRSAEAAKEIKALISTSGRQVEQGVAFVGQTGEALARIVAEVAEIDGIVGEIASSAQEQAAGLDEVNTAVNQMDQVTQQNAAMVEETTAASHALAQETGELTRLIGAFRLGEGAAAGRSSPARDTRPAPRAAAPVRALRTVGRGGAARAPGPAAVGADWVEF